MSGTRKSSPAGAEVSREDALTRREFKTEFDNATSDLEGRLTRARILHEFGKFDLAAKLAAEIAAEAGSESVGNQAKLLALSAQVATGMSSFDDFAKSADQLIPGTPGAALLRARNTRRVLTSPGTNPSASAVQELRRLLESLTKNGEREPLLGIGTVGEAAQYQLCALHADLRNYHAASETVHNIADERVHAAAVVLRARVQRAVGIKPEDRIITIGTDIERLSKEEFEADGRLIGEDGTLSFKHDHAIAALLRHQAVAEYATDVGKAIKTLEAADVRRDRIYPVADLSDDDSFEPVHSYALCRYHVMNNDRGSALATARNLLRTRDLNRCATRFDAVIAGSADDGTFATEAQVELESLDERHTRAVLAVVQVLRTVGHDTEALKWLAATNRETKSGRLVDAHRISLQRALGVDIESPELLDGQDVDAQEAFESERAQQLLAEGDDAALDAFGKLLRCGWHETKVDGIAGQIDYHRRKRSYSNAQAAWEGPIDQAGRSNSRLTQADFDAPAVTIARAWTEMQLGDPREARTLFVQALLQSRYSVSGWVGLARCLRLLGHTSDAIVLVQRLRGTTSKPFTLIDSIPILALRHGPLLASEEGWCWLDLDQWLNAQDAFDDALDAAPYLMSAQRGRLAAAAIDPGFDPKAAVSKAEQDIINSTGKLSSTARAHLCAEAGRICLGQHREVEASHQFDKAMDSARKSQPIVLEQTRRAIASAYLDAGKLSEAEQVLPQLRTPTYDTFESIDDRDQLLKVRYLLRKRRPLEARNKTIGANHRVGSNSWLNDALVHFELRDFTAVERRLADAHRPTGLDRTVARSSGASPGVSSDPHRYGSDIIALLAAWNFLAQSEMPGGMVDDKGNSRLEAADRIMRQTDMCSTDELHIDAVIQAKLALETGRSIETALVRILEALGRRPFDTPLLRDAAAIHLAAGDLNKAESFLQQAIDHSRYDARTHLLTGVLESRRGSNRAAIQHFERAVKLDPLDHVHHRALAVAVGQTGKPSEAIETIDYGIEVISAALADGTRPVRRIKHAGISELELLRSRYTYESVRSAEKAVRQRTLTQAADRLSSHCDIDAKLPQPLFNEFKIREAFLRLHAGDWKTADSRIRSIYEPVGNEGTEYLSVKRATQDLRPKWPIKVRNPFRFFNRLVVLVGTVLLLLSLGTAVVDQTGLGLPDASSDAPQRSTRQTTDLDQAANESEPETPALNDAETTTSQTPSADEIEEGSSPPIWELVAGLIALQLALLLPDLAPRLTSITIKDLSIALESLEPVNEYVHVDLDLSAARLVQISGFANHRPGVPLDDIESRIKDSLPG